MENVTTVNGIENHKVVSQNEWLKARMDLLKAEKELTRQSDEVARQRQAMPRVRVDKDYQFETAQGKQSLADLFRGRQQLMIYHFMYGPEYKAGCPSCSAIADGFNGITPHLANHDVMLWAVSRAPLVTLLTYEQRMGWTFPWASFGDSDFGKDFGVSFTEEQIRNGTAEYNYHKPDMEWRKGQEGGGPEVEDQFAAMTGTDTVTYHRERPGMSTFVLVKGIVYHAYSTYERGVDALWAMYQWLDRAPLGRNEKGLWFRRHDEYDRELPGNGASKSCCS